MGAIGRLDPSLRLSAPDGEGIVWIHYRTTAGMDCAEDAAGLALSVRDALFMALTTSMTEHQ